MDNHMPQPVTDTQPSTQRIDGTLVRADDGSVIVDLDEKNRSFTLSFSSDKPYLRSNWFEDPWIETLGHDDNEADFSRLSDGAPLLFNHDRFKRDNFIGVVEKAWLEGGKGFATVRLSKEGHTESFWNDIKNKIIRNVSVGYKILERTLTKANKEGPDEYRVTKWLPMEISLVTIPADQSVGVGRSENYQVIDLNREEPNMPQPNVQEKENQSPSETDVNRSQEPHQFDEKQVAERAATQALRQEQSRQDEIRAMFKPYGELYRTLMDGYLSDQDMNPDAARAAFLDELGKRASPTGNPQTVSRAEMGETEAEKFRTGAQMAIMVRAGLEAFNPNDGNHFRGYTLLELARHSLEIDGIRTGSMDKMALVARAFTNSTSDFTNILSSGANKAMLKGYEEAEESFSQFTSVGNLSDFKTVNRVGLSAFSELLEVGENDEYKTGTFSDRGETVRLLTYGRKFNLSRQAIINDDLGAFTRIPRGMGRASHRKVGDLVFAVLTANQVMSDGKALFHADHNNLETSGASPTVISVGSGRAAMRKHKDQSNEATLNIRAKHLIVPVALEDASKVLMTSETDPAKSNSKVPNSQRGTLEIVSDARLDEDSTIAWYMSSDPNVHDGIEVSYLDGNSAPFLDEQEGWNSDGVEFKVRIDAAAKALDHRTLYKNNGS